jgi:hypothetical protein
VGSLRIAMGVPKYIYLVVYTQKNSPPD